jgi:type I restriction enzyme S subunit
VKPPDWQTVPIKALYEGLYDGPHATPKPSESGPVFLGIKNLTEDGHLDLTEIRHIAEDDYPAWTRRVEPCPGDLVFTYEATLNRYALRICPESCRKAFWRNAPAERRLTLPPYAA